MQRVPEISHLYQQPMYEPVPSHLVDFVLQFGRDSAASQKKVSRPKNFLRACADKFISSAVWEKLLSPRRMAKAVSCVRDVAIGGGLGRGIGDRHRRRVHASER